METPLETIFSVACPQCQRRLKADIKHVGKTAKCPHCGTGVTIEMPSVAPSKDEKGSINIRSILEEKKTVLAARQNPVPPSLDSSAGKLKNERPAPAAIDDLEVLDDVEEMETAPVFPRIPNKKPKKTGLKASGQYPTQQKPVVLIAAGASIISLIIGFFLGREHLGYQLRSAFMHGPMGLGNALENGFGDLADQEPEPGQAPEIPMRSFHQAGSLAAGVLSAEVNSIILDRIFGGKGPSEEKYLIINMRIKNTDPRKVQAFHKDSLFQNSFKLVDDVGNAIRILDPGIDRIEGALTAGTDILPGQEVGHRLAFVIPLPKTKELTLLVNMQAFSGEGFFRVKIPANDILGFARR